MRLKDFLKQKTLGALLANVGIALGILLVIAIGYFYIYLPNTTNHGETITVPDLTGMKLEDVEKFLAEHELRFAVDDSVYHEEYPPLTILRQYPKAGAAVKQNRIIYVSINPVMPPTVPLPDLANPANTTSRIGAVAILKSLGLKSKISTRPHADLNLVLEMRYQGKKIEAGTRVPKGAVVELVIADGNGAMDFVLGDMVGDSYKGALFKLRAWNLLLGRVDILEDCDTTGADVVVYKQYPAANDSVRVGDQIDLTIGRRGCEVPEEEPVDPDSNNE